MEPMPFLEALDVLAHGEVHPLLLATDVERREDLTITVVLVDPVDDVQASGHRSTMPVFSRTFAGEGGASAERLRDARQQTVTDFAVRLRQVLETG